MKISNEQPKILVVGSSSIDLVLRVSQQPNKGETIMANVVENYFGGKGANQAVGVSRLGASSYFISCVGMDPMGQQVLRHLKDENVNVGFVTETEDAPTGSAYVTATTEQNTIVVAPSANQCLKPKHLDTAEKIFSTADLILLQLEIPTDTIEHTIELAKKYQKKIGIYAAPACKLSESVINYAHFIVLKKMDLNILFPEKSLEEVLKQYPNKIFVRDKDNTTLYYDGSEIKQYQETDAKIEHKMGMGDGFTTGFAVAYCHNNNIEDCVKMGNKIALNVSQQKGSQRGLPYLKDLKLN